MNNWFTEAFADFQEMNVAALIITIVAIVCGIVGIVWYRRRHQGANQVSRATWTTKELTTAALCIGLAFLLSFIKLLDLPQGGSVTPASMLPILAFAYIYGWKKGIIVGLVYSLLQFIQEPVVLTPMQVILDYPLAFGALGLAGFARRSIIPGVIYGCAGRFVCSFLSGWIFFGSYAPEGTPAWLYSLGYNGTILGVECAVCIVVALIPALTKTFNRQKALAAAAATQFHQGHKEFSQKTA